MDPSLGLTLSCVGKEGMNIHKETNKTSQFVQPSESKNLMFMKFHKIPSTLLTTSNSKSRGNTYFLFTVSKTVIGKSFKLRYTWTITHKHQIYLHKWINWAFLLQQYRHTHCLADFSVTDFHVCKSRVEIVQIYAVVQKLRYNQKKA